MYPTQSVNSERKFIEKLTGTKITLNLPTDINKISYNKVFNFRLENIQSARKVGAGELLGELLLSTGELLLLPLSLFTL